MIPGRAVTSFLHRLSCFGRNGSSPPPFPCSNHGGTSSLSCTCGLDTLLDGSLDFHKIAENILLFGKEEESQVADCFEDRTELAADFSKKEEKSDQVRIGRATIFSYDELNEATDFFNPSRKLRDGGYGSVYLGISQISLSQCLFLTSFEMFSLIGIVFKQLMQNPKFQIKFYRLIYQELVLAYEYVPYGTVADHLNGCQVTSNPLSWDLRIRIAIETAEALAYLHSIQLVPSTTYSDVKTDNILLDDTFNVKVADFRLSDQFSSDYPRDNPTMETLGRLDPVYNKHGKITVKCDVYNFGMVLLELISGENPEDVEGEEICSLALDKIRSKELEQLVDIQLGYDSDQQIRSMINSVAALAVRCLHEEGNMRPPIEEVLRILRCIQVDEGLEEADVVKALIKETVDNHDVGNEKLLHFTRQMAECRVTLQDAGFIHNVEQLRLQYGHNVASIVLFLLFKDRELHRDAPRNHPLASRDTTCHCLLYLQNTGTLEGVCDGILRSPCFSNFIFAFIMYFAAISDMLPQDVLQYCNSLFPSAEFQ